jgi:hypothetical protein
MEILLYNKIYISAGNGGARARGVQRGNPRGTATPQSAGYSDAAIRAVPRRIDGRSLFGYTPVGTAMALSRCRRHVNRNEGLNDDTLEKA